MERSKPGVPKKTSPHNRLHELRESAGLSQVEVAKRFHGGVTPAGISRHEQGVKHLSHVAVEQYGEIYKVWTYELFRERIGGDDAWQDGQYRLSRST